MSTKYRTFNLFFRNEKARNLSQYKGYRIKGEGINNAYENRKELLVAVRSCLIPYLDGMWDEVQIDIKATAYERNKD